MEKTTHERSKTGKEHGEAEKKNRGLCSQNSAACGEGTVIQEIREVMGTNVFRAFKAV